MMPDFSMIRLNIYIAGEQGEKCYECCTMQGQISLSKDILA
jgi:hypothetical protein